MNEKTVELLITNLPALLLAVGLFFASIVGTVLTIFTFRRAGRAERLAAASVEQSKVNTEKIEEVHKSTNGALAKLLDVTKASSKAEGILQEKDRQEGLSDGQ